MGAAVNCQLSTMPITLTDALNLLPASIRDTRGEHFVKIVYWMCCEADQLDTATIPPSLIPYKLAQFGLGQIAGQAARLPIASQRQLLAEASQIALISGSPYSIKRTLEIFGYPGTTFSENPTIDTIKKWGEFEVLMQQPFRYSEVEAIINMLKPPSRKLISIRYINAILLDGSRLLDGSTILEGLPGVEDSPTPWLDAATALAPIAELTPVPELVNSNNNDALGSFNPQLQALINILKLEDNANQILIQRTALLNQQLASLGGGSITPQLTSVSVGLTTLTNSNQLLLTRLNSLTPSVGSLTTKTNDLQTQTATITTASNARQLDVNVQRKNGNLTAIAALAITAPFPANKVIASTPGNNIAFQDTPALGAFIPQVASLEFKQTAGTNAGNYPTADVWAAMPFTVASNDDNFLATISASRFTLPAGTYIISYNWQGCGCLGFGGRLWNQTAGVAIEQGSPGLTATAGGSIGDTWAADGGLLAVFSISSNTNIEFQFRAKILHPNGAALTAGQSTSNAIEQVFQEAVIMRISN
jgi:hypothetical protein